MKNIKKIYWTIIIVIAVANGAGAQDIGEVTKLPIPRFVSLKANAVNLRAGPGTEYPIKWLYKKKNMPVEIIEEFERWRRVRTVDGETTGWVLHSLLSAKRTGFITPWQKNKNNLHIGRKYPNLNAKPQAKMQTGIMVEIIECEKNWCRIKTQNIKSWIQQEKIWGTYPNENF